MRLVILLSVAALVACDYPAAEPPAPSDSYGTPVADAAADDAEEQNPSPSTAVLEPGRSFFGFKNFYRGAFPPIALPPTNFLSRAPFPSRASFSPQFSFGYPLGSFSHPAPLTASPQGILPPISQILPPVSQIVPPISQIVPPILGGAKPVLPVNPSQVLPPQAFPPPAFPPSVLPSQSSQAFASQLPKYASAFSFPSAYYRPLTSYPYFGAAHAFFPSSPSFFSAPLPKEPAKAQQEPLPAAYGPPPSTAAESSAPFEPAGQAETSAPFEPAPPVSFPYEPAAPEAPESAPHKPAQEYGLPSGK